MRTVSITILIFISCLISITYFNICAAEENPLDHAVSVNSIAVNQVSGKTEIVIQTSQPVPFIPIYMDDPPELVIEFLTTEAVSRLDDHQVIQQGPLWSVRAGYLEEEFGGALPDGRRRIDRVSLLLKRPVAYRVYSEGSRIVVELSDQLTLGERLAAPLLPVTAPQVVPSPFVPAAPVSAAPPVVRTGPPVSPVAAAPIVSLPPMPPGPTGVVYNLSACQQVAEANHRPLQIAYEEVKLASLKLAEARRALYPTASVKWQETRSQVAGGLADSIGRRFFTELQQPLYNGGQLRNAYKQAKVNLEAAKKRYEKTRADLAFDVAKAYFTVVLAKRKIAVYEALLPEATGIETLMSKRVERGLSRRLELLTAESLRYQVESQFAAGRGDLAVASLGLQQVMNVGYPVDVEVVGYDRAVAIGLTEAQCVDVAQSHRADLEVNRLLVQFSDYGRRIAKARTGPQVNLSGLFGRGAENFDTEDLTFDNEWFVGLEVTYPWGLNPVKSSTVAQDRIPTAGQTESTEFTSHTLSVDLFAREAYAMRSERQAAEIEYAKAMDQLLKTEQSLLYAVKEGYTTYQKTLMQLDGSRQRMQLGEEQVKISRAMASLNEIPASDVLKSQVEWADSQVAYWQALADHHTAIAALNKAIGIPGYFH